LDCARDGRVAIERHVRSVLVAIGRVLLDQAEQVALTEHDHVVEQLAAQSPHEALSAPLLPRRSRSDDELLDAQVSHACVEQRPVDAVVVSNLSHNLSAGAYRLDDLSGPHGMRVGRDVDPLDESREARFLDLIEHLPLAKSDRDEAPLGHGAASIAGTNISDRPPG
jgi:hypothetical protein